MGATWKAIGVFAGALACVVAGWLASGTHSTETRITYLSVGQGDCSVFQTGGDAILIDDGPTEAAASLDILPKLRRLGVDHLDTILLSHPDADHVSGTPIVLHRYPSARIAISSEFRTNQEMIHELAKWSIPLDSVQWLPTHEQGSMGSFHLEIFCPKAVTDNDGSMIVRISSGDASAEFSGDASSQTEAKAEVDGDWRAEIMHAGHHGSRTATSDDWLQTVHPEFVVISCGRDNRYGHPHKETLARIAKEGAKLYRTDLNGDISFVLRDGRFVPAALP